MKKLDISSITNSSRMPVKKGTLQFLQDAYAEPLASIVQALIGPGYNPSLVYILSGVVNSGTLPAFNVTAGVAFYNGEVFSVDAASFSVTGENTAVFSIVQTQYTVDADPVTFTDSAVRSIHNIRKIQVVQGLAGTELATYNQAVFLSFVIPAQVNITAAGGETYPDNYAQVVGAYPNIGIYVPTPAASAYPILAAGYINFGNLDPDNATFTVTFPAPISTGNYYVMGTLISQGASKYNDCSATFAISNRTDSSFQVTVREQTATVQNVGFEYMCFKKP